MTTTDTPAPPVDHTLHGDYLDASLAVSKLLKRPELTKGDRQLLEVSQHVLHKFAYDSETGTAMQKAWDEKYRPASPADPADAPTQSPELVAAE